MHQLLIHAAFLDNLHHISLPTSAPDGVFKAIHTGIRSLIKKEIKPQFSFLEMKSDISYQEKSELHTKVPKVLDLYLCMVELRMYFSSL